MEIATLYKLFLKYPTITTDTRGIKKNALFFALKGANFNANEFAEEALRKGASYVVIDDARYAKKSDKYILVDNVLSTLQDLATYHREQLGLPIIALTGSNGKTTTKELIHAVLSKKYHIVSTIGNLNNHIGVPLTLLSMSNETEIGVVEMGANHFGEIAFLCQIAKPNYGYITNFGKAHLEGFGSLEGVVKAKSEMYSYLNEANGLAFINANDPTQMSQSVNQKREFIGDAVVELPNDTFVNVVYQENEIVSHLVGSYNFSNIAAAIGIGAYFNVSLKDIKSGIEEFVPDNKRSQLISKGTTEIVLDAYNANPTSMQAAIENFDQHKAVKKILILGDMFELGKSAAIEHQQIADLAESLGFDALIYIGENFFKVKTKKAIQFKNYSLFEKSFNKDSYENASILIKGSRGMALERIVSLF